MQISKTCPLVISDLYFYDFVSAYPTILKRLDWNLSGVDLNNKTERNIYIGNLQKGNKNLSSFFQTQVDTLLDYYLGVNNISSDNVILRQKDGFITNVPLRDNSSLMMLDKRFDISHAIISRDRRKILIATDDFVEVKGVSNYYKSLDMVYNEFRNLSFYSKSSLFSQMDKIKRMVFSVNEKRFYMVPRKDGYLINTHIGLLTIKNDSLFSLRDIEHSPYYEKFFREFIESLFLHFY